MKVIGRASLYRGRRSVCRKVVLSALLAMGLVGLLPSSGAFAQSETVMKNFPPIVSLWKRGKQVCSSRELAACVDVTLDVMKRISVLQGHTKGAGEKVLLIGTRALMAAGINEARAVVSYQETGADTACILLGNALTHLANASDSFSLLPLRDWRPKVKGAVTQMKRQANSDRKRLARYVGRICPSDRVF